ncbi:hypothetical protein COL24_00870 [Bacillus toyonensis]|uniref:hypothetical protein n=1 Tax=Bacillus toyonensis TaxID=155322 RepID=UPI000BF08AC0|nr:hypothetical protein [Bacillus toyonensis]PEO24936.1 hypothetical protein CN589_26085 [Bacillus toyonensis]PFX45597.1 hypothetical protein COL24_00870 [Bacillus toyonensis]PFX97218.1 hypothetical protein COL45_28335 [Bacillus toyonensis]PHB76830.1 hypothetical protein COE93_16805 [Bacillus toyonensis]
MEYNIKNILSNMDTSISYSLKFLDDPNFNRVNRHIKSMVNAFKAAEFFNQNSEHELTLVLLRSHAEFLTKALCILENIRGTNINNQKDRNFHLWQHGHITRKQYKLLEEIRAKGNSSTHEPGYSARNSTYLLNKAVYLHGWFMNKYSSEKLIVTMPLPSKLLFKSSNLK